MLHNNSMKYICKFITILTVVYTVTFALWDSFSVFPKIFFNMGICFGFCCFGIIFIKGIDNNAYSVKRKRLLYPNMLLLYVFSILYYLASAIFLTDPLLRFNGIYIYIYYQFFFLCALFYLKYVNPVDLIGVIKVLAVISGIASIYEMITSKLLVDAIAYGITYDGSYVVRPRAFSGSFLTLAMFFSIFTVIFWYYLLTRRKITDVIALCISIVGLFATSSRGPLVACVIGCLITYLCYYRIRNVKVLHKIICVTLIVGLLIIFGLMILNSVLDNSFYINYFVDRIKSIFDWNTEKGNTERIMQWSKALLLIKNNLFFGTGVGSTGTRASKLIGALNPESGFLMRLVDIGILGTVLYYSFIVRILFMGVRFCNKFKNQKDKLNYVPMFMGICCAIIVEDFVMQITETVVIAVWFWGTLAYIYTYSRDY